jgi:hypothetical protein
MLPRESNPSTSWKTLGFRSADDPPLIIDIYPLVNF